jgi:hypothetical protein
MYSMYEWLFDRAKEPSTYAAIAIAGCGLGILVDQPYLVIGGIAVAILALVLKEKGVY